MARLTLRIDFDASRQIGPGKIRLLELIDSSGSISAAGRQMGMSWPVTRALLSMIPSLLPVQPLTVDIHETGLALAERCGLSPCDAIIAAIGRCTPIATRCGPKICRTGSCSMIACASSTRFVLHYIEI